jgi:pimeloyl-ACP methyl ester carboxylesterase
MGWVTVQNQSIHFLSQGTQGVPIILVHGSGSTHEIWTPQVRALASIARPVAVDLPGHGRSDSPGRNSVEAYRDVILGLLDVLHLDRAMIVGHSLGGAIAQAMALSHPDRVVALGLVGTGARLRVLQTILDGLISDFDKTASLIVENSHAPNLSDDMRIRAMAELRACNPVVTQGDYSACNAFDVMLRVGEIQAPTIVMCGKQDRMTPPKYSEFLAAQIPGAQWVLVDNAGHNVMIEQPDVVSHALFAFVQKSNL